MDQPAIVSPPQKPATLPNIFKRMAENPVILKELRGRMRGRRAFLFLTFYLIVISLFIGVIYALMAAQANLLQWQDPGFRQNVGKIIFSSVVLFEFMLIGFIGPALTAGAITSERERQTFDLLRTTLLSARALVFGKLGSACMYLVLLVFAALPIEALAFLLGGVGIEEVLVSSLILVVNIVFFCTLGLFCSSFTKRTLTATVTSYALILLSMLALGLVVFVMGFYAASNIGNSSSSPLFADMLALVLWLMSSTNSFSAAIVSEVFLIQNQTLLLVNLPLSGTSTIYLISPWITHIALYLVLTAIMIFLTVMFVKRPDR
jgi:ABC-type transport system involved in multi-copper enzyme maturation permease subunit